MNLIELKLITNLTYVLSFVKHGVGASHIDDKSKYNLPIKTWAVLIQQIILHFFCYNFNVVDYEGLTIT